MPLNKETKPITSRMQHKFSFLKQSTVSLNLQFSFFLPGCLTKDHIFTMHQISSFHDTNDVQENGYVLFNLVLLLPQDLSEKKGR